MEDVYVVYRWSRVGPPVSLCECSSPQRASEIVSMFRADYPDDSYYWMVEQRTFLGWDA